MLVHSWLDIVCLFRPYDALHTMYTSEFFSTEYFLVRSISSDTRVQRYHPTNKYIYIYICFKNVKMKQVCKGMVRFRRATNRLVFRQEFEARFIGRDIKVLATGVYIYILDSSKYDYFKIRILIYSASRCDFLIREYFVLNCGRNYYSKYRNRDLLANINI